LIEVKKLLENERILNDLKVLEGDRSRNFTNFYDYSNTFENKSEQE
jgi:hypothetical protein